jgi:peptidoglycan-associated lipoprotein
MTNFGRFSSLLMFLMTLSLLATGCGSKDKKNQLSEGEGDQYPDGNVQEEGLLLNGDSDAGKAGSLRTVYFEYDSSQLSSQARSTLENNAAFLKESTTVEVQIEGHADERGGVQYNIALGQRRAKTVKQFLESMGVAGSRISIVSYGKERPLEFGHDEKAWSKNRRANFVVTAK